MKNKENSLFKEWKAESLKFIPDGVVDEAVYIGTKQKVLFILKEVNGGENWDLRTFLKNGGRKQTWNNIALWQFGIQNIKNNYTWKDLKKKLNKNFRIEQLNSIVALNIKKEAGGHTSNSKEIWKYANKKRNKEFLRRQIKIYNPHIIICCGTPTADIVKSYQLVEKFEKWKLSTLGIKYHITEDNEIIINYCHPAARIDDNFKYFPLIDTIKEIQNLILE